MDQNMSDVIAVFSKTPSRWLSFVDKIPAELLERPGAPGEWSALACLSHLLDVEIHVLGPRLQAFLAGQDIPAFDPDSEGTDYTADSPAHLAAEFARHRSENLALLDRVGEADLARTVRHAELGSVTLGQMLHQVAAHDLIHMVQAERALMQPFLAGCGPWRQYYTEHEMHGA